MKTRSLTASMAACVALALTLATGPSPANAETEYRRGPDPTSAGLEKNGPFAYSSYTVSDWSTPGFGAATIYYPTTTSQGTFGGVAISPGYTETQSAISWLGPRLSSHGFVVITFNTNSRYDDPAKRSTQLLAALDYLTGSSSVRNRVDSTRLAVMGHSMGGGGAIQATKTRTSLQASVPMTPWHTDKTWPEVRTPTAIIAAENDTVAPTSNHAEPFYTSMPSTLQKTYAEMDGAGHNATNYDNPRTSRVSVAWLKRWVDNDTRYTQFLCPVPASPTTTWSDYRATCPF